MKRTIILIFTIIFCMPCPGQQYNSIFFSPHQIKPQHTNKLFFSVNNVNFFKNNEYFNKIEKGYTLTGYFIEPALTYYPSQSVRIKAGAHLLKNYGPKGFEQVQPLISVQVELAQNLYLIFGSIYGTIHHRLIEPVYHFERFLEKNNEEGLQFLYDSKRMYADVWLNWEKFIRPGDPFQEEFNAGSFFELRAIEKNRLNIYLPLQLTAKHTGGQINTGNDQVTSVFNTSVGTKIQYGMNNQNNHIWLEGHYVNYFGQVPDEWAFKKGNGLYLQSGLLFGPFHILLTYWKAKKYLSPLGNPIYQSMSKTDYSYTESNRSLLIPEIQYTKRIISGVDIGVRFTGYYDFKHKNPDYSYSIYLLFRRDFFITKINPNFI
jgi:hypothetical protein